MKSLVSRRAAFSHIRFKSAHTLSFLSFLLLYIYRLFSCRRLSCRDNALCNYEKTSSPFIIPQIRWSHSTTTDHGNHGKTTDLTSLCGWNLTESHKRRRWRRGGGDRRLSLKIQTDIQRMFHICSMYVLCTFHAYAYLCLYDSADLQYVVIMFCKCLDGLLKSDEK